MSLLTGWSLSEKDQVRWYLIKTRLLSCLITILTMVLFFWSKLTMVLAVTWLWQSMCWKVNVFRVYNVCTFKSENLILYCFQNLVYYFAWFSLTSLEFKRLFSHIKYLNILLIWVVVDAFKVWAGPLSRRRLVVALWNRCSETVNITAAWEVLGLDSSTSVSVRDLWQVRM